jgi:hypothetical protein
VLPKGGQKACSVRGFPKQDPTSGGPQGVSEMLVPKGLYPREGSPRGDPKSVPTRGVTKGGVPQGGVPQIVVLQWGSGTGCTKRGVRQVGSHKGGPSRGVLIFWSPKWGPQKGFSKGGYSRGSTNGLP